MWVKFKQQRPIDRFIVDCFCAELKLIIEFDGNSHYSEPDYVEYRQKRLISLGYTMLRFEEGVVLNRFSEVHERLMYSMM